MEKIVSNKPTIITSDIIWQKLESIEKMIASTKQKRMFNGLLVNDIVNDLKVTADFVIKEWITPGKLKAVYVGGKDRVRGGWRISLDDYIQFLHDLKSNSTDENKIMYIPSPQQIINEFHKQRNKKVA